MRIHSNHNDGGSARSEKPLVQIEILRGQAKSKLRKIKGPVYLIGSASDCDMVLADKQFPDVHMYVYVKNGKVTLRCLGSGPFVTLNGDEVGSATLQDGDRIRTGPYEFRFVISAPTTPERQRRRREPTVSIAGSTFAYAHDEQGEKAVQRLLEDVAASLKSPDQRLKYFVEADLKRALIRSA